jgi:hypothetical protein
MHHDQEQKVAQLLTEIGLVLRPDRLGHFISLLEEAGD